MRRWLIWRAMAPDTKSAEHVEASPNGGVGLNTEPNCWEVALDLWAPPVCKLSYQEGEVLIMPNDIHVMNAK